MKVISYFTFSICPSSGYWSRMDLNCWMSDGWIKSNPSSSLLAEKQIKTDISGNFKETKHIRTWLKNIRTSIYTGFSCWRIDAPCRQEWHFSWHFWLSDNSGSSGHIYAPHPPHELSTDGRRLYNLRAGANSWKLWFKNASLYRSLANNSFSTFLRFLITISRVHVGYEMICNHLIHVPETSIISNAYRI